jgi:hypothetical protein
MGVSKNRKNHKSKVIVFKRKLVEKKKTLEKLYIQRLNDMILKDNQKNEVENQTNVNKV